MRIGKYELAEELGHGSMGTVYRARDTLLDRFVAVKLISASVQLNEKLKTLFEREARVVARMSHPNVITIHDFDYAGQQPYIVMELLHGGNLDQLKPSELSLAEKLTILIQVCRGLAHSHEQNVIHRDIKPSNIYVTSSGVVKITDFGIARIATATTTGTIMGTPEFMSPEQVKGEPLDARSDLFSVGTVAYWLFTGNSPFAWESVHAILYRVLNLVPPPMSLTDVSDEIQQKLESIVERCMQKDRENRYPSAAQLASDLEVVLKMLPADEGALKRLETLALSDISATNRTATTATINELPGTVTDGTIKLEGRVPPPQQPAPTTVVTPQPSSRRTFLFAALAVAILIAGALYLYPRFAGKQEGKAVESAASQSAFVPAATLRIGYSGDKDRWLSHVIESYSKSTAGSKIKIEPVQTDSLNIADDLAYGEDNFDIWWPASDLEESAFIQEWQRKNSKNPVFSKKNTALTPMVFLMWSEPYKEFIKKYKKLSFRTVAEAVAAKKGWEEIARRPDWGIFRFASSDPATSNSGALMLLLLAHEYHQLPSVLELKHIQDPGFQTYLKEMKPKIRIIGKSTNEVLDKMLLEGPSKYDVVFGYENAAIDHISDAEGRWGSLNVAYPQYNFWNENPFYILDAPWVSAEERKAAEDFMKFVMQEKVQREALEHGFRPGDLRIPVLSPDSPFEKRKEIGLQTNAGIMCDPPSPEVISAMIELWKSL